MNTRGRQIVIVGYMILMFFIGSAQSKIPAKVSTRVVSFNSKSVDIRSITQRLIQPYQSGTDKAAAIYLWIKKNIRYDFTRHGYFQEDPYLVNRTPAEVLEIKAGIAGDIANLADSMLKLAGFQTRVVEGVARCVYDMFTSDLEKCKHVWNAVKIGQEWKFIDCTWAILDVESSADYPFLAEPKQFIFTHYPNAPASAYLAKAPDMETFRNFPLVDPVSFKLFKWVPAEGYIITTENYFELPAFTNFSKFILQLEDVTRNAFVPANFKLIKNGEKDMYRINLPAAGQYIFRLQKKSSTISKLVFTSTDLISFRIDCLEKI